MNTINTVLMLGLVGSGIWLLYIERNLIRLGLASYQWARTEGTIVDSLDNSFTIAGVNNTNSGVVPVKYDETAHVYEYVVGDRTYRCDTYCFGGWADNAGAAYLIGTKVPVYYDPKHPEMAVLSRGLKFGAVFGLIPLIAGAVWAGLAFL